jgi:hypothetical protein
VVVACSAPVMDNAGREQMEIQLPKNVDSGMFLINFIFLWRKRAKFLCFYRVHFARMSDSMNLFLV